MSNMNIVIIGASVAGMKLAQNLHSAGFPGSVTLIDVETNPLYDKPPLSKDYLSGESTPENIQLTTEEELRAQNVTIRFGTRATALDPATKTVELDSGETLSYDTLVIATGAHARRTPWASVTGVHVLRTRADSDRLREELVPGRRLAVVGAGFIGAEAAATSLAAGLDVTIIEPLEAPMGRAMNPQVGAIFAEKHRREGIDFQFGLSVENVERVDGACRVTLTDGSTLNVDAVLLGIGAVPNTEWLETSGVPIANGVLCESTLAVVGVPDVYAIGDVARYNHDQHPDPVRLEHWTSAVDQALLVAHNITHPDDQREYNPTEYVWSDQYDWKIQIVGNPGSENATIIGDPDDNKFGIVYGVDGHPVEGAVIVNWPRALIDARRSVAAGTATEELTSRLRASVPTGITTT